MASAVRQLPLLKLYQEVVPAILASTPFCRLQLTQSLEP